MHARSRSRTLPPSRPGLVLAALVALVGAALVTATAAVAAQAPVGLGTATPYGVLAGSAISNTGPTIINGDLGLSPGTSVTGFPPGTVNGVQHVADAPAANAKADLKIAFDDAAARGPANAVTGDLGGRLLKAGVYRSASTLGLTGELTLDAEGDPNAVFIIQAGSSLTTATASRVTLVNGAQPCNVVWSVGSSATLGASTAFSGTVLAQTSITMDDAVVVQGRALARTGAITMINDTITPALCAAGTVQPGPPGVATAGGGNGTIGDGTAGGGTSGGGDGTNPGTTGAPVVGEATFGPRPPSVTSGRCVRGTFRAEVTGRSIRRVVFSVGGSVVATRGSRPFVAVLQATGRVRVLRARVTFTTAAAARTLTLRYRSCARAAVRAVPRRPRSPGGFTG